MEYLCPTGPVGTGMFISDGSTSFSAYAGNTIARDTWVHMVWVVDRTSGKVLVYQNAAFVGEVTIPGGFGDISNANSLTLGNGNGHPLTGSLDEVALYGSALSPAQVSAHYAAR